MIERVNGIGRCTMYEISLVERTSDSNIWLVGCISWVLYMYITTCTQADIQTTRKGVGELKGALGWNAHGMDIPPRPRGLLSLCGLFLS